MGWLTFTFTLQKRLQALYGDRLDIVRMHQQQENMRFLAHFYGNFFIHRGGRHEVDTRPTPRLYQLRSNGSLICTRSVEVDCVVASLNSCFCYILKVPFDRGSTQGLLYLWIGAQAPSHLVDIGESMLQHCMAHPRYSFTKQSVNEGAEPERFFWPSLIGGAKASTRLYESTADFMHYARLFRCSNEKGFFSVSEKCSDFCQDDLADDDIMILDNGSEVFLWAGRTSGDVEAKLAFKAAQVYIQNLRNKQPDRKRKLVLTVRGRESKRFTKCFQGWGRHKEVRQ